MSTKLAEGLPDSVRVGAFDFDFKLVDKVDDENAWGELDDSTHTISIKSEQPNAMFALDTVLHEVMHAVYAIYQCRVGDNEERVVCTLSSGLVQVFRDNPKLVAWMEKAASKAP